jgi:hypothetical protein
MAFFVADVNGGKDLYDPRYATLSIRQSLISTVKNETDGTYYRIFDGYDIPFSKCQLGKNVFYPNEEEIM